MSSHLNSYADHHALPALSASEALQALTEDSPRFAFIDTRSEAEFEEGSFSHFQNMPILSNQERHLVGLEYKTRGRELAIDLGHTLVAQEKARRIEAWQRAIQVSPAKIGVFCCWRGGLRSKIAAQWAQEAGCQVLQVKSGYKALRREMLKIFDSPPPLIILAGWTGSQKTKLLRATRFPVCDIEKYAHHRGSCFGQELSAHGYKTQPSQQTFDNRIGQALFLRNKTYAVEDESTRIGSLHIPTSLKAVMKTSPVVLIDATVDERVRHIYQEYIFEALKAGISLASIQQHFLSNLTYLHKKIGGLAYQELKTGITEAFQKGGELADHFPWIETLLVKHYDPSYRHAFLRNNREVLFRGSYRECLNWFDQKSSTISD
jgi:tRNA 2-selenouridine synthase